MKKVIFLAVAAAALSFSSCSTITHTASTESVDTEIINRSNADLEVSDKIITFTYTPDKAHLRAGEKAVLRAAVAKALEANGNADVLVAPQYEVKKTRGVFTNNIKYVIVKGHPAFYKNVHNTTKTEAEVVNVLNGGIIVNCNK